MKLKINYNGSFIELDFSEYSIDKIEVEASNKSKVKSKPKSKPKTKMGFI